METAAVCGVQVLTETQQWEVRRPGYAVTTKLGSSYFTSFTAPTTETERRTRVRGRQLSLTNGRSFFVPAVVHFPARCGDALRIVRSTGGAEIAVQNQARGAVWWLDPNAPLSFQKEHLSRFRLVAAIDSVWKIALGVSFFGGLPIAALVALFGSTSEGIALALLWVPVLVLGFSTRTATSRFLTARPPKPSGQLSADEIAGAKQLLRS